MKKSFLDNYLVEKKLKTSRSHSSYEKPPSVTLENAGFGLRPREKNLDYFMNMLSEKRKAFESIKSTTISGNPTVKINNRVEKDIKNLLIAPDRKQQILGQLPDNFDIRDRISFKSSLRQGIEESVDKNREFFRTKTQNTLRSNDYFGGRKSFFQNNENSGTMRERPSFCLNANERLSLFSERPKQKTWSLEKAVNEGKNQEFQKKNCLGNEKNQCSQETRQLFPEKMMQEMRFYNLEKSILEKKNNPEPLSQKFAGGLGLTAREKGCEEMPYRDLKLERSSETKTLERLHETILKIANNATIKNNDCKIISSLNRENDQFKERSYREITRIFEKTEKPSIFELEKFKTSRNFQEDSVEKKEKTPKKTPKNSNLTDFIDDFPLKTIENQKNNEKFVTILRKLNEMQKPKETKPFLLQNRLFMLERSPLKSRFSKGLEHFSMFFEGKARMIRKIALQTLMMWFYKVKYRENEKKLAYFSYIFQKLKKKTLFFVFLKLKYSFKTSFFIKKHKLKEKSDTLDDGAKTVAFQHFPHVASQITVNSDRDFHQRKNENYDYLYSEVENTAKFGQKNYSFPSKIKNQDEITALKLNESRENSQIFDRTLVNNKENHQNFRLSLAKSRENNQTHRSQLANSKENTQNTQNLPANNPLVGKKCSGKTTEKISDVPSFGYLINFSTQKDPNPPNSPEFNRRKPLFDLKLQETSPQKPPDLISEDPPISEISFEDKENLSFAWNSPKKNEGLGLRKRINERLEKENGRNSRKSVAVNKNCRNDSFY